jgi:hypothetical protein
MPARLGVGRYVHILLQDELVDDMYWLIDAASGSTIMLATALLSVGGFVERLQMVLLFNRQFLKYDLTAQSTWRVLMVAPAGASLTTRLPTSSNSRCTVCQGTASTIAREIEMASRRTHSGLSGCGWGGGRAR